MVELLLVGGMLVAAFVGVNVGGSNTGVAFGPAVGAGTVSKLGAGALMSLFALAGGWIVGREVVDTLQRGIVTGDPFTLEVSIVVLSFVALALLSGNVFGVPAPTSTTAVGTIVGLGLATGNLNVGEVRVIVGWWLVAPVVAFWASGVVGRYWYEDLADRLAIARSDGPLLALDRSRGVPRPALGADTTCREFAGTLLVVAIACYVAFSAGASNVANAVAPLVGSGDLTTNQGIVLAAGAMGLGALTVARRTLETMGDDLATLPLTAALVVAVVSATLVTALSALGVPASFVVVATTSVVGLGWGRATTMDPDRVAPATPGETPAGVDPALDPDGGVPAPELGAPVEAADAPGAIEPDDAPTVADLYRPFETVRVLALQNVVPAAATVGSYLVFRFVPHLA